MQILTAIAFLQFFINYRAAQRYDENQNFTVAKLFTWYSGKFPIPSINSVKSIRNSTILSYLQ